MAVFEFNTTKKQPTSTSKFEVNVELTSDKSVEEVGFLIHKFFEDVPEKMLLRLAKKLRKDPKTLTKLLNNPLMGLYI